MARRLTPPRGFKPPGVGGLNPSDTWKLELHELADRTGPRVHARLDENTYPDMIQVTYEQLAAVQIHGHQFQPERNYTIPLLAMPARRSRPSWRANSADVR